ncbi:MAG TPA: hypothetical protein VLM05_08405 [Mycobacteriales bacterium]|nr:hypothetical protein [Mycobacteriales bacterium]
MTADNRRPPLPPPAHPDLDTLADLHADALDASTAERVRAHASSCPQCGPVLAALDGVRDELHALPVPPMPAAVAARLDTTLADLRRTGLPDSRQPTGRAAAASRPATVRPETARPETSRPETGRPEGSRPGSVRRLDELEAARARKRRRWTRGLGAVAAAAAVIAGGASVTALVRSGTSNGGDSSAAGSAADSGALPAPAAASGGTTTSLSLPSYDQATLRAALPQIAQRSAVEIITGEGPAGPAGPMADVGRRTACAAAIGGDRGELKAVLRIRYLGTPAYVFVFEDGGVRSGVVVTDTCGISSSLPVSVLTTVS